MTQIATLIFVVGIAGLFWLDYNPEARTSSALWLPVMWLWIAGSRPLSEWVTGGHVNSTDQYLDGSPFDRNIYIVLLAIAVVVLLSRSGAVFKVFRENGILVLFLLYCAFSILWSDYPDVAVKRWIKSLGDYAMILIVLTDQDRINAIKRVLARVSFILIPVSVLLIKYYPALGRKYATQWDATVYFTGVSTDKNMLGVCCLIFGLASAWRVLQELQGGREERKRGALIAHLAVVIMTAWLFAKCNSMTSLSCFLLGTGLMAITGFPKMSKKRVLIHTIVLSGLIFCFCVLFLDLGSFILEMLGRNPTLTGRTELWETIRTMNTSPVLGAGFESFWLGRRLEKLWSIYWWHPNEAHDGYLEMYLNLGWIGVSLLGAILITGYRNAIRKLREDSVTGSLYLSYFFIGVAYNFTEAATRTMSPVWFFLIMASIALPKAPVSIKVSEPLPQLTGTHKKAMLDRTPENVPA
jgi:exopolysaccharide production protein ExoQ